MKIAIILILLVLLLVGVGLAAFGVYQRYKDQEDADEQIRAIAREGKPGEYTADQQRRAQEIQDSVTLKRPSFICGVLLAIITLVSLIIVPGSIHQVDAGETAVVKHLGKVKGVRGPGIHWDFYMTNSYVIYPTTVQEISLDSLAYSSDTQYIGLTAEMQYKIKADKVDFIESEYKGLTNLENKIKVVALDNVKAVYAKYKASNIMEKRDAISTEVFSTVKATVEAAYPVELITCAVPNIDFSDTFEKSVEDALAAKVKAEQEAQQAQAEAEKARIQADAELYKAQQEAEAKVAEAEAEARAILAKSEASAKSELLLADANATATKLKSGAVAEIVGFDVTYEYNEDGSVKNIVIDLGTATTDTEIESRDARIKLMAAYLEYMQYLEVWNGTLPVTVVGDDAATIVLGPNVGV